MSLFDSAVQYVLLKEGGGETTDNPKDPGGITKYGISLRAYPHLGRDGIINLTEADAIVIYKRDYWDFLKCDQLPPAVAFSVFDSAVNQGQPTAAKLLQRACGVQDDGIVGPATIAASVHTDVHKFTLERIVRYTQAIKWKEFGRGWISRALETFSRSLSL